MTIFDYNDDEALGSVIAVDTATVTVRVDDLERLKRIQVNRLMVLQSSRAGQHLVGVVSKITRKADDKNDADTDPEKADAPLPENNLVKVSLIGTLSDRLGSKNNVFQRTLETVPEIEANCFSLEGERLTRFMQVISNVEEQGARLSLGNFTLDDGAEAFLNGDKLFQRHAIVVGSTGSGKSWTTARLLEQISSLPQSNVIVFDLHGEYGPLTGEAYRHFKVAGPMDLDSKSDLEDGVLYLPFWLLGYESLVSLFVDRSDQNAPNQTMQMTKCITDAKKATLEKVADKDFLANFTIDSPVPFSLQEVLGALKSLNTQMVPGANNREKQGPYFDKLSRLIARLESKIGDRRLGFLFQPPDVCMQFDWLAKLVQFLAAGRGAQGDEQGGIKIVDFSEVPSDVLPLMVSLLANVIFTTNQWTARSERHPIALFCDEAHLYIPERSASDSSDSISVSVFERIAKEGRKYGVGLVVISQRPSEVNRTVLSQCNNVIAMRLTNGDDQNVIRRLLPDSLGGFGELLPVLDIGEALVVGDASLLPTRVRVSEPLQQPDSKTIEFWTRWGGEESPTTAEEAVASWRRQGIRSSKG